MADSLYIKNGIIGRLFGYFNLYFSCCPAPTAESLSLLVLAMLAVESAGSIRLLYRHFLSKITRKSINAFYYVCSYAKAYYSGFMNITSKLALGLIPDDLRQEPVFLCIDDTIIPKADTHFEDVSNIFDHAAHGGSNYLNGHCFVSPMLCVSVWNQRKVSHLCVPLGYRLWQKKCSKLQLVAEIVRSIMPEFMERQQVFLLFDSWYAKKTLLCLSEEFLNLEIICNARYDSAIYDFPESHTGRKGRPAKRGRLRSVMDDFVLSTEKIGDIIPDCGR